MSDYQVGDVTDIVFRYNPDPVEVRGAKLQEGDVLPLYRDGKQVGTATVGPTRCAVTGALVEECKDCYIHDGDPTYRITFLIS